MNILKQCGIVMISCLAPEAGSHHDAFSFQSALGSPKEGQNYKVGTGQ